MLSGLPVRIKDRSFVTDPRATSRRMVPTQRQGVAQGQPGRGSVNIEGIWAHVVDSWHHGAGQVMQDDVYADPARFWASTGVVTDRAGQIELAYGPSATLAAGIHATIQDIQPVVTPWTPSKDRVWWVTGTSPYIQRAEWSVTTGTFSAVTNVTGCSEAITGLATFYNMIFAAGGTGTVFWCNAFAEPDDIFHPWTARAAKDGIYVAGHRLIGLHEKDVFEYIPTTGGNKPIWVHPDLGKWLHVVGAPGAIFGLYERAGENLIYCWADLDAGVDLGAPFIAAANLERLNHLQVIDGSLLLAVGSQGNVAGFQLFQINQDGTLNTGPVVRGARRNTDWPFGDTDAVANSAPAVGMVESRGLNVVTAGPLANEVDPAGAITKIDLGRFVEVGGVPQAFVPAFVHYDDINLPAPLVCAFGRSFTKNLYVLGPNNLMMYRLWPETAGTAPRQFQGTLQTGWFTFGVPNAKQPLQLVVRHEPLPPGGAIDAQIVGPEGYDISNDELLDKVEETGTRTVFDLSNEPPHERFYIVLRLTRGTDTTRSPKVLGGMEVRVRPVFERQEQVAMGLVLGHEVRSSQGRGFQEDPLEAWRYLRDLMMTGEVVKVQEGEYVYHAVVDDVAWPNGAMSWDGQQRWYQGTVFVTLMTLGLDQYL